MSEPTGTDYAHGAGSPQPAPACRWSAVHDFMPPTPARLRVNGTCEMPTPGYTVTLSRASPQGINPRILLLHLHIEPPTGMVIQVITPTPVSYEEQTDFHYESVSIIEAGVTISVQEVR
jgi:hypothetical protein